jgi:hypothetical protein
VSGVTFTYAGPTVVTISKCTDVDFQKGGRPLQFYGDGARFPTALKVVESQRSVSVMTGNKAASYSVPEDTVGTLVWIEQDLNNGTGTGARTYTLINCKMITNPHKGPENRVGDSSLTFASFSTDGTTDPLSVVIAS